VGWSCTAQGTPKKYNAGDDGTPRKLETDLEEFTSGRGIPYRDGIASWAQGRGGKGK